MPAGREWMAKALWVLTKNDESRSDFDCVEDIISLLTYAGISVTRNSQA